MSDTEDYLELESILDSCIVDDGKRWYNVKWKTAWLTLEQLPEEALKDYHCSKDTTCHEKIYSILEEKVDQKDGFMKYLLCSVNTWEPEVKLSKLYPVLLTSYWSENSNREDIVKVDVASNEIVDFKRSDTSDCSNGSKDEDETNCDVHGNEMNGQHSSVNFKLRIKLMSKAADKMGQNGENGEKDIEHVGYKDEGDPTEKTYSCIDCGKEFARPGSFKMHMRTHTGEKPYECSECGKHFSQKGTLTVHARIHTGEKPFKCWFCDKQFSCHHYLKVHLTTHTGEKPHKCGECGKMFSQKGTLNIHVRTHTGEKPFKCLVCAKQFSCQYYLKLHMTTHSDEKPYHCEVCSKQFVRSDSLKVHMRSHNNEKPFQCKICDKQFSSSNSLKLHEATHSGEKAHACDECGKEFSLKSSLMRHLKVHSKHNALIDCSISTIFAAEV